MFAELPEGVAPQSSHAGPWCEARWLAGKRPTQRRVYDVLDSRGHKDYAELMVAGGITSSAHVAPLLERCWGAVITVARQLNRTGDVRHDDICATLGIPATDNGYELSLIRSSSTPGSFTVTRAA